VAAAELLTRLAAEPERAALLLDVDGTLAPIVARPEDAAVPDATQAELERLARRYALVACVSGRTSEDAARIVGVPGIVYVGEHGLELAPEAERWRERLAEFADEVAWPAERKRLSVSFHWRTAPNPEAAQAYLERVAERARAADLRPRFGRMVLEIRPPVDANKGTAVRALLAERELRRALYAGDDATDIDAFLGLDGLEIAVRIAISSVEAPGDLAAAADLVLAEPAALLELLRQL
jgi:trehalose 6-phosphate phosphatase